MSSLICECARCCESLRVPVDALLVAVLSTLLAAACAPLVVTLGGERE